MLIAERIDRIDPAEPIDKMDPAEPIDKIEPADPIDKMDPAEPIDKIEPADPIDRIDPAEPIDGGALPAGPISAFSQVWQGSTSAGPATASINASEQPVTGDRLTGSGRTPADQPPEPVSLDVVVTC